MRCPDCGHENPANYSFCGSCGRPATALAASASMGRTRTPGSQAPVFADDHPAPPVAAPRTEAVPTRSGGHDTNRSHDATRYLCAAVNMNDNLARAAIEDVLEEQHRAIAVTPGADLVTIMKYALAADRRRLICDVLLLVELLGLIVMIFLASRSALFGAMFLVLLVAAWLTVFIYCYICNFASAAQGLRQGKFDPGSAPAPAHDPFAERQLARISSARNMGNVTVYSAFSPFVGYGSIQSSWSFTVDVTRGEDGAEPMPFTVREVYDHVKESLNELDVHGIEVTDRLFVNGRDIYADRRFLPDPKGRPVSQVDDEVLRTLMSAPEERASPYLAVNVGGWQGDLVVTVFVRFLLSRTDLFVEAADTAVAPLQASFRGIDELKETPTARQFFRMVRWSSIQTLPRLLGSVKGVIHELNSTSRRDRKQRKVDRTSDFGSKFSIREAAADNKWQRYFQVFDRERYTKVIERRGFRSLVEFLDDHDIDTSELESRQETIVNNGVMIKGKGSLQVDQLAVGKSASVNVMSRIRGQHGRSSGGGSSK